MADICVEPSLKAPPRSETDGRTWALAILVSVCAATAYRAVMKPFWYDELFTVYMVRLGSFDRIWAALHDGVDFNPPLLYGATALSEAVFGSGQLGTRVPAIAGFLCLLICLFEFTARRLPAPYALQAMLLPALMGTYTYAFEARSYGMVLGFAGLALLCWQRAAERDGRGSYWVLGLGVALTGALLTHCYSVLLLPPLAAGEAVRALRSRRIDWRVWWGILIPCASVAVYFPLLESLKGYQSRGPIFDPTFWRMLEAYFVILLPALAPLFLSLLILGLAAKFSGEKLRFRFAALRQRVPDHELVFALVSSLTPVIGFLLSLTVKGGFFARYALGAAIGLSLLFTWMCFTAAGESFRWRAMLPGILAIWFCGAFLVSATAPPRPLLPESPLLTAWKSSGTTPLVIADGQTFLELDRYLDRETASRLVFLTDRPSALRYMQTDCYDRVLQVIRPWFPVRGQLIPYEEFVSSHKSFLVYGFTLADHHWILAKLQADGARIEAKSQWGRRTLTEVSVVR